LKKAKVLLLFVGIIYVFTGCFPVYIPEETNESKVDDNLPEDSKVFGDLEIIGEISTVQVYEGTTWLYGKVKNNSDNTHVFIKISCDVYDKDNKYITNNYTYLDGTVVKLSFGNTNTALKKGETGYFSTYADYDLEDIGSVKCKVSSSDNHTITEPEAKLSLEGEMKVTDSDNSVRYSGELKNSGTKGLIFGEIYLYSIDKNGVIKGWEDTYVSGSTVYIASIDADTDTALSPGETGTFLTTEYSFEYSQYGEVVYFFDWEDNEIKDGVAVEESPSFFSSKAINLKYNYSLKELKDYKDRKTDKILEVIEEMK